MTKRDYDTTVARIAGNIAAGLVLLPHYNLPFQLVVHDSVRLARAIVAETKRTEVVESGLHPHTYKGTGEGACVICGQQRGGRHL